MCIDCKLNELREKEAMKLKLTEALLSFLKSFEVSRDKEDPESLPTFRIGLREGRFWVGWEDPKEIMISDVLVTCYEEEGRKLFNVYCDCEDLELLEGTTVDYDLHGLSKRITFKDERFSDIYITGDLHPVYMPQ